MAETRLDDYHQKKTWHRHKDIREPHQKCIHFPSHISAYRPNHSPDHDGHNHGEKANGQGYPAPVERSCKIIPPKLVHSEPVLGRRRLKFAQYILLIRIIRAKRRQKGSDNNDGKNHTAYYRQLILPKRS